MTIAKSRHGVTWNVFTLLVVNSLTFYLRTFWGWEYHQSIGNQKLDLFSVVWHLKGGRYFIGRHFICRYLEAKWRKPLHCAPTPQAPAAPGGSGAMQRFSLPQKVFYEKTKIWKKNPKKSDFGPFYRVRETNFAIFLYITHVYFTLDIIRKHEIKWLFSSSLVKKLSKIHIFLLFFTIYRSFQLNHQNCWKFKNRFKTLFCYVWTHVNTFPVLVVPNFGFILSCSRKLVLRSKSPPTFQVTPFHGTHQHRPHLIMLILDFCAVALAIKCLILQSNIHNF